MNQARFGVSRLVGTTGFQNQFPLSAIGMSRFNSGDFTDIPLIELSGSFELGYSVNDDQADNETTWQYFDNTSWLKGRHNMNFGMEMRRYQDNYFSNNNMRGSITSSASRIFCWARVVRQPRATEQGIATCTRYRGLGVVQRYDRLRDFALFGQDSWKPWVRLTVNAGLRWEYIGLPTDIYGRDGAFDPRGTRRLPRDFRPRSASCRRAMLGTRCRELRRFPTRLPTRWAS